MWIRRPGLAEYKAKMDMDFMTLNSCFMVGYATFFFFYLSFPLLQIKSL
jgi:hypothetical protein